MTMRLWRAGIAMFSVLGVAGAVQADVTITASPVAASPGVDAGTGLNGNVFLLSPITSSVNLTSAKTIAAGTPTATFLGTTINYNANEAQPLTAFLGADAATLNPITTATTAPRSSVFDLKGFIDITNTSSPITFSLNVDDDGGIYLNGNGTPGSGDVVVEKTCCGTATSAVTFTNGAGLYPIEILFDNQDFQNGGGGITLAAQENGTNLSTPILYTTPEPASIGLLGCGVLTLLARRRRA